MKTCVALYHVAFEDLGLFGPVLEEAGYQLRLLQAGVHPLDDPTIAAADLLVILGGPIGVPDVADYPFVQTEIDLAAARIQAGRPTLGICLGAQIIAAAAGARVYPGPAKEIGWAPLQLTPAGLASPLAPLAPDVPVLHWHGDTFDLPPGATLLASTPLTPHQVFALGEHTLALQCHLEADPAQLERWLIGHCGELARAGISPGSLRAATAVAGPAIAVAGPRVLAAWLAALPGDHRHPGQP